MRTHPAHLLIVDDEPSVRTVLKRILQKQYCVTTAANGEEALQKLAANAYDLLLLDLKMGGIEGLEVLKAARGKDPEIIVIILTAYGALDSAVEALRLGAFDYIFKPAASDLLRERVAEGIRRRNRALQQRALLQQIASLKETLESMDEPQDAELVPRDERRFLRSGPLTIDRYHRTALFNGHPLHLTTAEFDVLLCLVQASPNSLNPQELVLCALGYDENPIEARRIIKWHIHRLRRKLEPDPPDPMYIKTIRSRGYLWSGE